ncbi:hypothetical protein [Polaromonas sp.]|uniref:hypothetical protein n=1 Tax=Polaromonas sp. TaxID=1869339 RepID=UPI003264BDE9
MSGRAAVPDLRSGSPQVDAWGQAVKQNMDWMTGQQKNAPVLKELPATATLQEVIAQQNKILQRLLG